MLNSKFFSLLAMAIALGSIACSKKPYTVIKDTALIQNPDDKKPAKVAGGDLKRGEHVFLSEEKNFGGKKFLMVQIDKVSTKGWIDATMVIPGKIESATVLRDTDFFSRPSLKSPKTGKVKAGVVIFVLGHEEQFAKVQYPGGEGYIEKANLGDANSVVRSVNLVGIGSAIVSATSTYKSSEGKEDEFDVRNAFDGALKSGWCEGKDGNGVGESVMVALPKPLKLDTVSIVNGLAMSEATYKNNNRVSQLTIIGSDQGQVTLNFDDGVIDYQERNLSSDIVQGGTFTFRIEGVHAGKANDTCLGDIKITGTEVSYPAYGGGYGGH